ncbi:hypothetical protein TcWFU_007270 [Taenia crassiceps]|uniref:Uncharacterized protein n=1 Tax=Taenia crassiceps TaxID=6207 RepID=A0ABR4QM65_9CEST
MQRKRLRLPAVLQRLCHWKPGPLPRRNPQGALTQSINTKLILPCEPPCRNVLELLLRPGTCTTILESYFLHLEYVGRR